MMILQEQALFSRFLFIYYTIYNYFTLLTAIHNVRWFSVSVNIPNFLLSITHQVLIIIEFLSIVFAYLNTCQLCLPLLVRNFVFHCIFRIVKAIDPVVRPKGLGLGADKSAALQSRDKAATSASGPAEEDRLDMKVGAFCQVVSGKRDGQYGTVSINFALDHLLKHITASVI